METVDKMNKKQKQKLLEEAIVSFGQAAESLVQLLSHTFDLDLKNPNPFGKLITRKNNLWDGHLEGSWKYQFHGDACKFENLQTKQLVDVKINRKGHWGVISNFYLFKFIETTDSLKHVYQIIDSEGQVIELLEEMQKDGVLIDIGEPHFKALNLNKMHAIKS